MRIITSGESRASEKEKKKKKKVSINAASIFIVKLEVGTLKTLGLLSLRMVVAPSRAGH